MPRSRLLPPCPRSLVALAVAALLAEACGGDDEGARTDGAGEAGAAPSATATAPGRPARTRQGEREPAPGLELRAPRDGTATRRAAVVVRGITDSRTRVTVAGRAADTTPLPDTDGELSRFRARVGLRLGRNEIEVVSARAGGPPARVAVSVRRLRPRAASRGCHPAYRGACVPRGGDAECARIGARDFRSVGGDPYRLDGDGDGVACET